MQSIDATIGPAEACAAISFFFYGVMAMQVYLYCQSDFLEDSLLTKSTVILICIVETVHTIYIGIYIYSCTITHAGDAEYATLLVIPLQVIVGSGLVIVVVVQIFFSWRVYALSKSWIVAAVLKVVSSIRACGMISLRVVLPEHLTSIHDYIIDNRWLIVTLFSMTWFIDIFNTGMLVYYLLRDGTYSRKTQKIIEKIIMWTVETGILTCIFSTTMMVLGHSDLDEPGIHCQMMILIISVLV
ncbi:hypothetical protein HETIRDRAFT_115723 [Heterobasidion irregulare TC 32-1]|uniref:DUF6534 domain-containing protein n=1 Tax=Heterobasidion irregulare (strain TC 32-1) TaxID=747525 RepID=W4K4R3_HETIT|nr:uncharacterized protein HETIRDRAFT_115723 [Heterobasidion irregulare TC 32-1]ETW80345.1 hypothetical protein HETIRDRAFT_115723 [Heterobasidion irregulare TC 32-1]